MNAMYFDSVVALGGTLEYPSTRRPFNVGHLVSLSRQGIASDPSGTTSVTFAGVNAGSEIRVYLPDGTETAGVESCDANHALTWAVYPTENANNVVTVRIVNTAYKIKEFSYTAAEGAQTLPVQQELDKWYANP